MNFLSLFAGIGGIDLGLERAGMTCVGQVEIDPYCQQVLAKHWPDIPRHDDVRTCVQWWQAEPRPTVDLICGGPPCQPVSIAGRRRYTADQRWMWPAMADTIRALQPRYALVENVAGLLIRGLDAILADLAESGFDAEWSLISACSMGAPHTRERMFVVAHTDRGRRDGWTRILRAARRTESTDSRRWCSEPAIRRMAPRIPRRVDRVKALGNAVVPQVAEHVGRLILEHDQQQVSA